jgi:hypothetical protein
LDEGMVKDVRNTGSGHPITVAVARVSAEINSVAEAPTWSMRPADLRDALAGIAQSRAQLDELETRVLAQAETGDALAESGATSTAALLAHTTRTTKFEAHRRVRLARHLPGHDVVRQAMVAGHVQSDQATVICAAVDALPDDIDLRHRCEKHLVALAEHHDAKELKLLGRRVLEVVDPDAADAHEAALLEKEERDAARSTSFSMWATGDGTVRGKFTLPELEGHMLRKALMSLAAPKHVRSTGETYEHDRPTAERLGQAFAAYVSRYPADKLPHAGGSNATVVVTMTLDTLLGGLEAATIDTGARLSAGAVRRLACEAGLVPVVLDGASRPLDVGRQRRFHTETQRLALAIEQKHCQHPTCDAPAWLCHVHHITAWIRGGKTDLKNAQLLCPRHHSLAHRDPPMRS